MRLLLLNNSDDTFTYASGSVVVNPNSTTEVSSIYWFALYSDDTFFTDINQSSVVVSDGITSYRREDAMSYMQKIAFDINYNNKDIDGATIVRTKAAKKGWSFWAIPIEITTSTLLAGVYCKDSTGTNIQGITGKIYDNSDLEITTAGLAGINLGQCVKTVIDFEPAFDYEIIGGSLRTNSAVAQDIRLWIVGAPDIPAASGGSKEFASGINLKFLDGSFEIDGRVSKFLSYNASTHQNKMRIMLKHPAGVQLNMQIVIHIYRL